MPKVTHIFEWDRDPVVELDNNTTLVRNGLGQWAVSPKARIETSGDMHPMWFPSDGDWRDVLAEEDVAVIENYL